MKLVTFTPSERGAHLGVLVGDSGHGIHEIADLGGASPPARTEPMIGFLRESERGLDRARRAIELVTSGAEAPVMPSTITIEAPVMQPGKILGIGRNYGAHAAEGGLAAQEQPRIFVKASSAVIGTGHPIPKPPTVTKLDYETELAVVIGREARRVTERDALSFVGGYTILNDVSARELQFDRSPPQTSFAKSMDGFCPMGPWLVTPDEIPDPGNLRLRCWINGELVQDGNTRDMIFPVPRLIAYLSSYVMLHPGDVIATGTPAGVGAFRKPPRYLVAGDDIRMEIGGIGVLENRVISAESAQH